MTNKKATAPLPFLTVHCNNWTEHSWGYPHTNWPCHTLTPLTETASPLNLQAASHTAFSPQLLPLREEKCALHTKSKVFADMSIHSCSLGSTRGIQVPSVWLTAGTQNGPQVYYAHCQRSVKMAHSINPKMLSLVSVVKLHLFQERGGLCSKAGEALWCRHLMYNHLPHDMEQASP